MPDTSPQPDDGPAPAPRAPLAKHRALPLQPDASRTPEVGDAASDNPYAPSLGSLAPAPVRRFHRPVMGGGFWSQVGFLVLALIVLTAFFNYLAGWTIALLISLLGAVVRVASLRRPITEPVPPDSWATTALWMSWPLMTIIGTISLVTSGIAFFATCAMFFDHSGNPPWFVIWTATGFTGFLTFAPMFYLSLGRRN
jgi:hypothetical protein